MKIIILMILLGVSSCATSGKSKIKNDEGNIINSLQSYQPVKIVEKEIKQKKQVLKKKEKGYFKKESAVYDVSLKGMNAGTAIIKAEGQKNGKEEFSAHIKTNSFISMFFKVEHKIKSLWSKSSGSHFFSFNGIEGGVRKNRVQKVDSNKKIVNISSTEEKEGKKFKKDKIKPWVQPTQDFLSSFFFVRTINWEKEKIKGFLVLDNGTVKKVEGVYKGLEEIRVNGKKYLAKIVEVRYRNNNSNFNKFWITKDNLLVKIQANLKIGTMIFELDKYTKDL